MLHIECVARWRGERRNLMKNEEKRIRSTTTPRHDEEYEEDKEI